MVESVFDPFAFRTLIEDVGEETANEIIAVFFADTESSLIRLGTEEFVGNRDAVGRQAHAIKSSSATFGFNALSAIARKLEADADALLPSELNSRLGEIERAFRAARREYDTCRTKTLGRAG
jgi:histidine phosphotransfer protein HptB